MFCSHYARAAMLCLLFANVSIAMVTSNVLNNLAHCIVLTFISELNVKLIDKFAGKMSVTTLMPRRLEDRVKHERFLRDNLMRWTFNRFTKYVILSMLMITLLRAFGTPPDAND